MQASGQIFRKIFRTDNTRRVRLTYYVYHYTTMMFAISSGINSLRLHVVRKSHKPISHHYCGCCMAVVCALFLKRNRSASYGCRKTSVQNREAAWQPYRRRLVSWHVYFWASKQPQGRPTTISYVDILGGPVNWLILSSEGCTAAAR